MKKLIFLILFLPTLLLAKTFSLIEARIDDIQDALKQHQITCEHLISEYLTRIKTYNLSLNRGAPMNAFVSLNASVINEARELDSFFKKTGQLKGLLHCIPVVVKDNIDTVDSPSTSGTLALLGSQPMTDADLVKKLKRAGALIIGKGTMDEWVAGGMGISSRSGRTGNAYDPNKNPGGSSGGVAVAVSANLSMVGIGTDNSGSVRIPAAFNGIYGLRPSTGLISQAGILPLGNLDATAGPMARTIKDLAMTLSVISGRPGYEKDLDPLFLKNKRIAIVRQVGGIKTFRIQKASVKTVLNHTYKQLKNLGAELLVIDLPRFNTDRDNNMSGEVEEINDYLASFPSTRKNYTDICESGRLLAFKDSKGCLKHIKETAGKHSFAYYKTRLLFFNNRRYLENIMKKNHIDAFLTPISSEGETAATMRPVNTWRAPLSSNSGLPAINFIAGFSDEKIPLPVGLQLIGRFHGEKELINMVYAIESHSPPRRVPNLGIIKKNPLERMSIPQFNNLLTQIGYLAFEKVLSQESPYHLTARRFKQLITPLLEKSAKVGDSCYLLNFKSVHKIDYLANK